MEQIISPEYGSAGSLPTDSCAGLPDHRLSAHFSNARLPLHGYADDGNSLRGMEHRGLSVFVVEDEALISMYICERLNALGYRICGSAPSGEQALRQIPQAQPDLVLMDIRLAGPMDGVATALQLREHTTVPVVFLTAYADSDLVQQAAQTGAYGYLVKPFDERELHATIQVAIERARANAALKQHVAERTRELRDSVADMEFFSYMVAHELRGPFLSLSGFTKLILQEHAADLDADATQLLHQMSRELNRMSALTNSLLDFATQTRKPVQRTTVAMRPLVDDTVAELRALSGERTLDIRIGNLPDAQCDPVLTRQVWRNLLANALKFSAASDPAMVTADFDAATGAWFVRDNGVGFDKQHADKLFLPFSRLHSNRQFEGSGIGLATVERIVRAHGGRIWAESSPGAGACFYFTLGANP